MNHQRERMYSQRRKVLEGKSLYEDICYMIEQEVDRLIKSHISPEMSPEEYIEEEMNMLLREIHSLIPQLSYLSMVDISGLKYPVLYEKLKNLALDAYARHEAGIINLYNNVLSNAPDVQNFEPQEINSGDNIMRNIERDVVLGIVDNKWVDHLHGIDILREGIGLRAYGQKDPLIEYKREAFDMFNQMMFEIQRETVTIIFRTRIDVEIAHSKEKPLETNLSKAAENFIPVTEEDIFQNGDKVGRNDLCPCGSGIKYKKCCGLKVNKA
jgi:preprotein translocase subunit SecA